MNIRIRNLAFIFSGLGLFVELAALMPFPNNSQQFSQGIRSVFSSLELSYFNIRLLEYYNFDTGLRLSYLNLTGYGLLLLGAILYARSNGKEARLVRAITALIFIGNILGIFFGVITPIIYSDQLHYITTSGWTFQVLGFLVNLGWAYLAYTILRWFQQERVLATEIFIEPDGTQTKKFLNASKLVRFTNWIVDLFTVIFVFSPFVRSFGFLGRLEEAVGEQFALMVFLGITRFLYYTFFETLFQATPAKMFTQTRVMMVSGQKPDSTVIIGRTLSRFIPFEPLSFFGEKGWHDSIPNTQVVNEVRHGVSGFRYLWILLVIPVVAGVVYVMAELYDNYKSYLYRKGVHEAKIENFKKHLANLDSTMLIEIEDVNDRYSSDEIFLKVESVSGDKVMVAIIQRKEEYSESLRSIENLYLYYKKTESLFVIPVLRQDLENAITPDYRQSETDERNTRALLGDHRKFEIKSIDRLFGPSIHDRGTGSYGQDISMEFLNYGWPAQIISLETLEGTIEWIDELPKEVPTVKGSDYPSFYVRGSKYERGSKYKFKMVIKDSLNHTQTYFIEGHDLKKKIERIE